MDQKIIKEWERTLTDKENLPAIKKNARGFVKEHSVHECWEVAQACWQSPYFQVQEIASLLCGHIAYQHHEAYLFLRDIVSYHQDWRVQEVLAMSFDCYCQSIGYENALSVIHEWLTLSNPNNRRAVSEGLRVWTSKDYFCDHPQIAIQILSSLKEDESLYVRKSVGNALKDISKKYPELIINECEQWDLSDKKVKQVYQLAYKFMKKDNKK